jgi:uncharacterized paraquat-inducible protein A
MRRVRSVGGSFVRVAFLTLALFMPLLLVALLALLWLLPLRLAAARRVYVLCEVVRAWAALDVFGVSLVVALLEISQFAEFIIGNKCDAINVLLRKVCETCVQGGGVCLVLMLASSIYQQHCMVTTDVLA